MVKKSSPFSEASEGARAGAAGLFDGELADQVRASMQQIWLAGLGAFSKAQEEGGRVFETLVQDGVALQRKTQAAAESKLAAVSAQVSQQMADVGQKVEEVSAQAANQWDRLGNLFEQRVAAALGSLGVPQAGEVQALAAEVAQLRAEVAALRAAAAQPARSRSAAASPATAGTAARKRSTPKA